MAKASIVIDDITPGANSAVIKFHYNTKAAYKVIPTEGIRLYYSTTGTVTGDSPHVDINITTENSYYTTENGVNVEYTFVNPTYETQLWIQLRMQIWTNDDSWHSYYASYRYPKNSGELIEFKSAQHENELFMIAKYSNPVTVTDEDGSTYTTYTKTWEDYTQCIALPSYDVNYEDINEDWDDANYVTHRVRVRQRISGKLSMWFSNLPQYNRFIDLLKKSKQCNGNGPAYVELRLQINDDLDEDTGTGVDDRKCTFSTGLFFIKMDSNPWVAPIFGHYDRYQAVNLTIQEA